MRVLCSSCFKTDLGKGQGRVCFLLLITKSCLQAASELLFLINTPISGPPERSFPPTKIFVPQPPESTCIDILCTRNPFWDEKCRDGICWNWDYGNRNYGKGNCENGKYRNGNVGVEAVRVGSFRQDPSATNPSLRLSLPPSLLELLEQAKCWTSNPE